MDQTVSDISKLVYRKAEGGKFRWVTVSVLMLAIGMILHLVSPSVAGFTPNWMIATYCVAILLTKPTYRQCLGICMIAALMEVFTSKSAFPYGDFASEFAGAYIAGFFAHSMPEMKIGRFSMRPSLCGFITTLVSGFVFVSILTWVLRMPSAVYLYAMLPMVGLVAVGNAFITPFLYFPARRLLSSASGKEKSKEEPDSDHSGLLLQASGDGIIEVEHLTYCYPRGERPALEDVNLSVKKGDFTVLTGPNGAGKTTLLMSLVGAVPHYFGGVMHGMVFVDGKATTQSRVADLAYHIGVILSDYDAQIVTMTVGEEMAFSLGNSGFPRNEIIRRTEDALEKVHLKGLENHLISDLSGGQRQRLVIASVLAEEPDVLVFDEPTSALDPEGIQSFYRLLGNLNREFGITVIVADHHLGEVPPYANRFVLIDKGHILETGAPEKVMKFMFNYGIYSEAVPDLYKIQLQLEKKNIYFKEKFLNLDTARRAVSHSIEGSHLQ